MTKAVCIVGMHRSGTSCLAGSLEEAGVFLGDVARVGRFNPKGNRESTRIMDLQEEILTHNGGSWDRPPAAPGWTDAHRGRRDAILRDYADVALWGFKDPRTLLLIDFWREALPAIQFVGSFRHPWLVADSLLHRGGGATQTWIDLWTHYNARLLKLHEANPFPIVRFDLGESEYRRSLTAVLRSLDLTASGGMTFFDPDLRHQMAPAEDFLPSTTSQIYDGLCEISVDVMKADLT